MQKYRMLKDMITVYCENNDRFIDLHRIEAVRDFGSVKKGDLGGLVEAENCLSDEGDCWIDYDSMVFDNGWVSCNAKVYRSKIYGDSWVCGNVKIFDSCIGGFAHVCGGAVVFDSRVGNNFIYGDAMVFGGNTFLYGDAKVFGSSVSDNGSFKLGKIKNSNPINDHKFGEKLSNNYKETIYYNFDLLNDKLEFFKNYLELINKKIESSSEESVRYDLESEKKILKEYVISCVKKIEKNASDICDI